MRIKRVGTSRGMTKQRYENLKKDRAALKKTKLGTKAAFIEKYGSTADRLKKEKERVTKLKNLEKKREQVALKKPKPTHKPWGEKSVAGKREYQEILQKDRRKKGLPPRKVVTGQATDTKKKAVGKPKPPEMRKITPQPKPEVKQAKFITWEKGKKPKPPKEERITPITKTRPKPTLDTQYQHRLPKPKPNGQRGGPYKRPTWKTAQLKPKPTATRTTGRTASTAPTGPKRALPARIGGKRDTDIASAKAKAGRGAAVRGTATTTRPKSKPSPGFKSWTTPAPGFKAKPTPGRPTIKPTTGPPAPGRHTTAPHYPKPKVKQAKFITTTRPKPAQERTITPQPRTKAGGPARKLVQVREPARAAPVRTLRSKPKAVRQTLGARSAPKPTLRGQAKARRASAGAFFRAQRARQKK